MKHSYHLHVEGGEGCGRGECVRAAKLRDIDEGALCWRRMNAEERGVAERRSDATGNRHIRQQHELFYEPIRVHVGVQLDSRGISRFV